MRLEYLPLDQIDEPSLDIRTWVSRERLDELRDLIIGHGFRDPITVKERNGRYEIVDGHRRWMAAREAGLIKIPCIVVDDNEPENEATKLILNLGREDLSPLEISRHLHVLKDRYGYSNEDLARIMNVGEGRIRQLLGLTKLDPVLIQAMEDKRIGERVATLLQQVPDEERRHYLLQYALDQGATIKVIENWVRAEKTRGVEPPKWQGPEGEQPPPEEMAPFRLQCACCHKRMDANIMLSMTLDPECYAIAERLFREIRKNVYKEEEEDDRQAGMDTAPPSELQSRDSGKGIQRGAHDSNSDPVDNEDEGILGFLKIIGTIH
jgi:ParB family chromosome partitioning protein